MALQLLHLDERTRRFMLDEFFRDLAAKRLYLSSRLSDIGLKAYPKLLETAITTHSDAWLSRELRLCGRMRAVKVRRTAKGGYTVAAMPDNAPELLAENEFNRYYIRGLCRRAIEERIAELVIYRAKEVKTPRPWSQRRVGTTVSPRLLLGDLRDRFATQSTFHVPAGPNSGLSVKLP